jgi:hypothetical protein
MLKHAGYLKRVAREFTSETKEIANQYKQRDIMKTKHKPAFAALLPMLQCFGATRRRGGQILLAACAAAALVIGCSTTKSTENMLSAAGFKIIPATTPQQQAHLKTLPRDKITMVERKGTNYFVFPDAKSQVLYVGKSAQYQEYQKLRLQNQMAEEQADAAELSSAPGWEAWGTFDDAVVVPVRLR